MIISSTISRYIKLDRLQEDKHLVLNLVISEKAVGQDEVVKSIEHLICSYLGILESVFSKSNSFSQY